MTMMMVIDARNDAIPAGGEGVNVVWDACIIYDIRVLLYCIIIQVACCS
jgi:hypothetical protein